MGRIVALVAFLLMIAYTYPATAQQRDDAAQRAARAASGPGPVVYSRDGKRGGTRGCYTLGNANAMDEARKKWPRAEFVAEFNRAMLIDGLCDEYVKRLKLIVLDRYPNRKLIKVKRADGTGKELWVFEDMIDRQ